VWRFAVSLVGVLALAGCASEDGVGKPSPAAASPGRPAQAVAAALAFAAHSDPDVAVVDGYATVPLPVQRGEQQIDRPEEHPRPCAQSPAQPFTATERATIRAAFHGRTVHFVGDPAAALRARGPGALLLAATRALLGDQHGTVMVISCVPGPQEVLVNVHWDGHAWQAVATGAG
jgi:hypothetical protein